MTLARCTEPGCPVRFRDGTDRLCALHREDGDTVAARMERFAELAAVPHQRDAADDHPPDDQ